MSNFLQQAGTAGNMQTYATDLRARQQAEAVANALNALKLQAGQDEQAGSGIAGKALLANLAGPPTAPPVTGMGPAPQAPMPSSPPPGGAPPQQGGMQNVPFPGAMAGTQQAGGQAMPQMPQLPASQLGSGPTAPRQPQATAGGPQPGMQQLTWKNIATAIKQQAPNATGPQVMAAIDKISPMMSAQNKTDWESFKLSIQSQLKEQGLQQQLQIANQKNDTTQRGQDVRAQTSGGNATPEEIQFLVDEVKSGNQSILARMPANVRLKVADALQAGGTSGSTAANSALTYHGKQSEASKVGQQLGGLEVAGEGFKAIAPDALKASAAVPRESWTGAAKLGNWLREQSNDPKFVAFQNFNLGLVREYARAMGGTVSAQNKATEALGTAKNQAAYKSAVDTLQREIDLATKGGKKALTDVTGSGDTTVEPDGVPPSGNPDGWSIKARGR